MILLFKGKTSVSSCGSLEVKLQISASKTTSLLCLMISEASTDDAEQFVACGIRVPTKHHKPYMEVGSEPTDRLYQGTKRSVENGKMFLSTATTNKSTHRN